MKKLRSQQPIPLVTQVTPYTLTAGYKILNGNIVQCYNRDEGEYIDDRTLIPLLVMPDINVYDTHKNTVFTPVLTGVDWYEGVPSTSTLISSGTDYVISASGAPQYSLKMYKNVDVNSPINIYYRAYFTDERLNKTITVEGVIPVRTSYFDSSNYSVKLAQPKAFTVDPCRASKNSDDWMEVRLAAQFYSGSDAVADANSAYFWYVLEGGTWRLLNANDIYLMSGLANGKFSKEIVVNASFFENRSFKVAASFYEGDVYPTAPSDGGNQDTTTINVSYPEMAESKMSQSKGMYIGADTDTPIDCTCWVEDNTGEVPNYKENYMCLWFAKAYTMNSTPQQIGHDWNLSTTSAKIGVTNTEGVQIYAEVYELSHWMPVVVEVGALLVNHTVAWNMARKAQ